MLTENLRNCISRRKAELEEYLTMIEEAKKRDHRKLGKELGLFMMREEGPGFPFFLPNGMVSKKYPAGLLERDPHKGRLCGDFYADHAEPPSLGDVRTLGSL